MKRVLFYFNNFCGPDSHGGTEIATYRIAKALGDSGLCQIFHACHGAPEEPGIYSKVISLPKDTKGFSSVLSNFIKENEIDNVVVMSRFFKYPKILKAIELSGRKPTLIFMQHFAPGSEKKKTSYPASWHLLKMNPRRVKYWLRAIFYPLLKLPRTLRWKSVYKNVYEKSDRIVLLSEGYKSDYANFAGLRDQSKFVAIPNIFLPDEGRKALPSNKGKRVLIMSRMDELQKRISLALQIWRKIEDDPDLSEWRLDIVGDGNNTDIVKRLIKKLELENAVYHGWQKREPFLENASILMLTSEYEGLPLSILEARAYGVVPIAFNSFASLKDVVTPFENGVVVDDFGDIGSFAQKLSELMYSDDYRRELAANAHKDFNRFSPETIAQQWLKILT